MARRASSKERLFELLLLLVAFACLRIVTFHPECVTHQAGSSFFQESVSSTALASNKTLGDRHASPMCTHLAQASAMSLWTNHIGEIHQASRLPKDKAFKLHDKTAEALRIMTPRLALGQRSMSRDWKAMDRILQKLHNSYEHYTNHPESKTAPEPVKIVVFGGSVTAGINCFTGVSGSDVLKCAWSARLESLINQFAGHPLVSVFNMAISGSNTKTGTAILKYGMLPPYAENPDIIINGYSTNDMHVQTILEAAEGGATLRDEVFSMSQEFARSALDRQRPPLLLWLDDYIGNEQPEILATTELSQGVQVLAQYYGFSFVSYADTVRDLVYGDTHEGLFSPGMWYKKESAKRMQREIHPSQGMHMATSWLVAYHLAHLATTYCSLEGFNVANYEEIMDYETNHTVPGLPRMRGQSSWPRKPYPRPRGLPPVLTAGLKLEQVTDQWRDAAALTEKRHTEHFAERHCPFTWVSGINPDISVKKTARAVQKLFAPYLKSSDWDLIDDTNRGDKLGWMPKTSSAKPLVFEFTTNATVQRVVVFFLRSYGAKWEQSTVEVTIEVPGSTHRLSRELHGFHDKKTSEMYTEELAFETPVQPGGLIRMSVKLVGGTTFKLMGLAVCQ